MHDKPCPKCGHCPTCGRSNAPVNPFGPYWQRPWYGPQFISHPLRGQTSVAGTPPQGATYSNQVSAFQLSNAI